MDQRQIEPGARDQLKGGQLIGRGGAGVSEERHHVLDPGEPEKRGLDLARLGKQLQGRGGDDPERAFAADEKMLQIVAGIVLAQPAQPVPDPPIRQHDFETQGQLARIAVAQYRNPAGIGRQISADLAAALGAEAEGEQPVGLAGRLLQMRQDAAGLDGHREIDRVDLADAVHAAEGENDLGPVLGRDAASDEAGVAALRHDRQPGFGADPHHRRDLLGRCRPNHEPGGAAPEAARLDQVGFLLGRIGDPAPRPDNCLDPFQRRLDFHASAP